MGFTLFPKNVKFFEYFARQQRLTAEAADALLAVCGGDGTLLEQCKRLNALEAEGNTLAREMARLLAETFITPIDREDVFRITAGYEEALNLMRAVAVRYGLYRPQGTGGVPRELAVNLVQMIAQCGILLDGISTDRYTEAPMLEIIRLKTENDHLLLAAMGELHELQAAGSMPVAAALAQAQILDRCEALLTGVERFAYVLEAIGIKNA